MHYAPPPDEAARRFMGIVEYKLILLRKHRADRVSVEAVEVVAHDLI